MTHGYEGEGEQSQQPHPIITQSGDPYKVVGKPNELGALTPDFSGTGNQLVFTSTAANLVYGDGNSPASPVSCCQAGDGSDVFEAMRDQFVTEPTPQSISPPPPSTIVPSWLLGVTAQPNANGSVDLYAEVPGSGRLLVSAQGSIVLRSHVTRRARRSRARLALVTRTVAARQATETAAAGGLIEITLSLQSRYATLANRSGGLPASVEVSFVSAGRPRLEQSLEIVFARSGHAARSRASRHARKADPRRDGRR